MKLHYKISDLVAASCLSLLFAMPVIAETSLHDSHQHEGLATSSLSLNQGSKWNSDEHLRQGMQSINDAVIKAVPAFHHNALTKPEAKQLANHINKQIEFLIANCKLTPQAVTNSPVVKLG